MSTDEYTNGNGARQAFRDIHNYLAGQFLGATRPETLLDEVLKCMFIKFYADTGLVENPLAAGNPISVAEAARAVFQVVRSDYTELYGDETEILLNPAAITYVLHRCDFPLLDENRDPIGDAYEVFIGSEARGKSGQFFTPRSVTDLLTDAVELQKGESILDPACGAGGFLTSVVRRMRRLGVTGKDLAQYVNDSVYGIEKDDYLARLARPHVALLSGGHPKVLCADSLSQIVDDGTPIGNRVPQSGVDVILTNPPFGKRIVAATEEVLASFDLAYKWKSQADGSFRRLHELRPSTPPQVLFVEACLRLLRDGGRLGMVVPESLLSNRSYSYVVEYLKSHASLEAVIGMPEELFKTSGKGGTHTKTALLVATKGKVEGHKGVFMAEAKWCGQDSRGRTIPYDDLPTIARNYGKMKAEAHWDSGSLGFVVDNDALSGQVLAPRYYDPGQTSLLDRLNNTHEFVRFGDLVNEGVVELRTGHEVGKLAYGTGNIPFIRTSDLSNWELKSDPKHGVSEDVYERLRAKQDVCEDDILMVKDGTYLIGTCALITGSDTRMVFQSHIYKIRVRPNDRGIDAFLLLAVLSSEPVQAQIKSKRFTQDIIDSLGDRIRELILPIPMTASGREAIADPARRAIALREEAKQLAEQARRAVVAS